MLGFFIGNGLSFKKEPYCPTLSPTASKASYLLPRVIILLSRLAAHGYMAKNQKEGFLPTAARRYFVFKACGTLLEGKKAKRRLPAYFYEP